MKTRIFILFIFIESIAIGQEKKWLEDRDSIFTSFSAEHFNLFAFEKHLSDKTKSDVLKKRELAYQEISEFFETNIDITVNIFLFQNEQIKHEITGHKGYGWGFDNNIVEVYNDSLKVDPYHELTHVIGYTINKTPALVDEGTAVYLSQIYGNNAFSNLIGFPSKGENEILLVLLEKEEMIETPTLLSFNDIGESNNPLLAYCQSASFVAFLIDNYGQKKFLELYKSLSTIENHKNEFLFHKIYNTEIETLEKEWTKTLKINKPVI